MALHPDLSFTQDVEDITIGVVNNTTPDYGTGGNPTRDAAAEYLLWSKTSQTGTRTLLPVDQGNVLTNLQYNVETPSDGWYEGIQLRIAFYDAGANYVEEQESGGVITQYASIFYYATTGEVYQAIVPSTGQDPTDTDYFEIVDDLSTLIPNTNVQTFIKDFMVEVRANKCVSSKFAKLADCGCSNSTDRENKNTLYLWSLVVAAQSEFQQGNPEEMEKIILQITSKCSNC